MGYLHLNRTEDVGQALWISYWTDQMKNQVLNYAEKHGKKLVGMEQEIAQLGFPKDSIILSNIKDKDALQSHDSSLIIKASNHENAIARISGMSDLMIISPSTIFKCFSSDIIIPNLRVIMHDLDDDTTSKLKRSSAINIETLPSNYVRANQVLSPNNVVKAINFEWRDKAEKIVKEKVKKTSPKLKRQMFGERTITATQY